MEEKKKKIDKTVIKPEKPEITDIDKMAKDENNEKDILSDEELSQAFKRSIGCGG